MKKSLLFFSFLLFLMGAQAQEQPQTKVDSMLVNIDKTSFTSGILYDRVVPFARLRAFNDSTNVSRAKHFEQALHELYRASNKEKFFSYKSYREFYTPDSLSNQADIGVLNASFHTLNYNPDSTELGALRVVNGLFEKIENGKPVFLPEHVFVASPTKLYLKPDEGQPVIFNFANNFLIQDTQGKNIIQLVANFGTTNNYKLVEAGNIIDQQVSIDYSEAGWKELNFIAVFADDSQMSVSAKVYVGFVSSSYTPPIRFCASNNMAYQGYTFDPEETYPVKGCIDYRIYLRDGGNKLMKPVIIIDGFDPGDKRKIQDDDSKLAPEDHVSMLDFMSYITDQGIPHHIKEDLNLEGYDVIMVNQPIYKVNKGQPNERTIDGGADYIERNAMVHIEFYQEINTILAQNNSTEQLIIVGPSMGGQISRYALAYMEAHNMPHNTRLWISVDSPHLGANIPLGLQSLLNQVANSGNTRAIDFVDAQLGSTAAKQQLIEQYKVETINIGGFTVESNTISPELLNGRTVGQGFSQNRGSDYFVEYYNNLYGNGLNNSRGYPQNVRRIAMVNGSLAGSDDFLNPFTEPAQMDNYVGDSGMAINIRAFQDILFNGHLHVGSLEAYNMPSYNQYSKVSRFKKAFNDESKYVTNINSRGNMDRIPGGWFPSFETMVGDLDGSDALPSNGSFWEGSWFDNVLHTLSNFFGGAELSVRTNEHVSSFIPTVSALGFISPDFNWYERFDRNLVCPGTPPEIPFHNYYGPEINERHVSFTEESVNWLLEEMSQNNVKPAPTVYLNGTDLAGPEHLCYLEIATYSIDACVVVDSWNVSTNNLQILSFTDQTVTVKYINATANGYAYIEAVLPYDTAKRNIEVGVPDVSPYISANPPYMANTPTTFYTEFAGNTEYHWTLTLVGSNCSGGNPAKFIGTNGTIGNNGTNYVSTTTSSSPILWGYCPGVYDVICEIRNECGPTFMVDTLRVNVVENPQNPCGPVEFIGISFGENPEDSGDDISANLEQYPCPPDYDDGDGSTTGDGPYPPTPPITVKIFDMQGNERYSNQFETSAFTISGLYLETGQFIMTAETENAYGNEMLLVQ